MFVAWITNHLKNGFFIFLGEGYEYVMSLTFIALVVGTLGPGQWSVDEHVSALRMLWGRPGFGISAFGGGIAISLIAVFWRPEKKEGLRNETLNELSTRTPLSRGLQSCPNPSLGCRFLMADQRPSC